MSNITEKDDLADRLEAAARRHVRMLSRCDDATVDDILESLSAIKGALIDCKLLRRGISPSEFRGAGSA